MCSRATTQRPTALRRSINCGTLADGVYILYLYGDTTIGKELVCPIQVYGGTLFCGATNLFTGPSFSGGSFGTTNCFAAHGNGAAASKTVGVYYQATVNPSENINWYIEFVGAAYKN
jgi:hypothetical protein